MFPDMSQFPPEYEEITLTVWDLLASGPLPLSDIAAYCRESGLLEKVVPEEFDTDLDAIDDMTMITPGIWTTQSGIAIRLDMLLSGRVFTHRLTDRERAAGEVAFDPDLAVIDADTGEFDMPLTLPNGYRLDINTPPMRDDGDPTVAGPAGWLDRFATDELLAFARGGNGNVKVSSVKTNTEGRREAAAIRDEFDACNQDPEAGCDLWPLLIEVLAVGRDLFTSAVPPIAELLAYIGLEYRDGCVGPTDTEWLPPGVVAARKRRAEISETFRFDVCCHVAFDTVTDAWDWNLGIVSTEPDAAAAAKALEHGEVCAAFISWIETMGGELIDVGAFFEDLGARAGSHGAVPLERAAWIWFIEGEVEDAIENANAAIAIDRDSPEATAVLGRVAAIRGDYAEALRLLRRSLPDDPWIEILEEIFEPFPDAKRNDPCPCGSGKKFKVCCAEHPQVSAIQRMHLLTHKIIAYLQTVESGRLHYLAHIAAAIHDRDDPQDIDRLVSHPFIIEIAAIEGSIDSFASLWGPFLPPDEADTIDLWRTSTRALWEVTDEPEDAHVTLRDTRTGDTVTVYDETATPNLHTGALIMGVVVPAFGEDRFLGDALTIDIRHRDMTLALFDEQPTDEELAHWFGLVTAAPRLQTTEGQTMVACRAVCEPTSTWEALTEELDAHYERAQGADGEWETTFINDAGETVLRGTLRKEGSRLIIETMSEERLDAILGRISTVVVVEESRDPVIPPSRLGPRPHGGTVSPEPPDPEAAAMLAEIMRNKEKAWLDQEIPLLDGLTPRQAAADPTRRGDLIALLDSFSPVEDSAMMTFDVERLRRLLGLD